MDFLLKVGLSFVVGGTYVAGVIWLSEKLGSRVGAIVAGLPSTILVSLIFISATQGVNVARSAVAVVPLMFIATLVYAAIFLRLLGKKWESSHGLVAFTSATALWLGVALLAIAVLHRTNFLVTVLIAIAGLMSFHAIFRRFSVMPPKKAFLPQHIYVVRFLLGAILVASAVVAARLLGPVWGGVIGSFPAMLGSVLYFLAKSQGPQFLEGFLRRLPAGYISSLTFIVLVHETITRLPVVLSFVVSLSAAALCASALLFLGPNRATTRPSVARQKAS